MPEQHKLEKWTIFMSYGPAISQSGCRKAALYQLPLINKNTKILCRWSIACHLKLTEITRINFEITRINFK